jgi:hypothetical protein
MEGLKISTKNKRPLKFSVTIIQQHNGSVTGHD